MRVAGTLYGFSCCGFFFPPRREKKPKQTKNYERTPQKKSQRETSSSETEPASPMPKDDPTSPMTPHLPQRVPCPALLHPSHSFYTNGPWPHGFPSPA